jgi:hypothetical protein
MEQRGLEKGEACGILAMAFTSTRAKLEKLEYNDLKSITVHGQ